MNTPWIRIAYTGLYLIALIAVFTAWSQVGGQGHLDIIPWYWKLTLGFGLSGAVVGFTAAMADGTHAINKRSVLWFVLVLALCGGVAAVTLQSHWNEGLEEPETEEETNAGYIPASQLRVR